MENTEFRKIEKYIKFSAVDVKRNKKLIEMELNIKLVDKWIYNEIINKIVKIAFIYWFWHLRNKQTWDDEKDKKIFTDWVNDLMIQVYDWCDELKIEKLYDLVKFYNEDMPKIEAEEIKFNFEMTDLWKDV